ncbi:S-layer homology domain-containing protein [Paenibacillus sp. LjRoot153]|uniref:S-layer homology domain-containing protein n=1 Tax=Paenibacillus sp. LjRoot153 TaxID=3342270 RepID=UPI003ED108E9
MRKLVMVTIVLSLLLAGCQLYPSPSVAEEPATELTDIGSHWAKKSIESAMSAGYVDGYQDSAFRPDYNITRAEFIKMLLVATKQVVAKPTEGSVWHKPYSDSATTLGVYHDTDFSNEKFDEKLTRVEMSKLAVRYLDQSARPSVANLYDTSAMYKAVSLGVIQGLVGGDLGPEQFTTRAQSVTVIERILAASAGKKLPVDRLALGNADLALTGSNTRVYMYTPSVPLPVRYSYGDSMDVTITSIAAHDMLDINDYVVKGIFALDPNNKIRTENLKKKLVVGLYVIIDNKVAGTETGLNLYSSVLSMIGLGATGDSASIYAMDTTTVGKTEGWIYYTIDKALNAKGLDGTLPFPLFLTVGNKEIYLTDINKK